LRGKKEWRVLIDGKNEGGGERGGEGEKGGIMEEKDGG
jgi:hypothetical protein